jgi:hypothetical protein
MEDIEIRRCLNKLDPDYYDRMVNILTLSQMMHDIFARSFMRELNRENVICSILSLHESIELAGEYERNCNDLKRKLNELHS